MTPTRAEQVEKICHLLNEHQYHAPQASRADDCARCLDFRAAIVTALLTLQQKTVEVCATAANAETQNSNHARALTGEESYELACRTIATALRATVGGKEMP